MKPKMYTREQMLQIYNIGEANGYASCAGTPNNFVSAEDFLNDLDTTNIPTYNKLHGYLRMSNSIAWWGKLNLEERNKLFQKYPAKINESQSDHIIRMFEEELEMVAKQCGF